MENNLKIGYRIWQVAKSKGFTKGKFAVAMGITRQTLANWIKSANVPDYVNIQKASNLLGFRFDDSKIDVTFAEEPKEKYGSDEVTRIRAELDKEKELIKAIRDNNESMRETIFLLKNENIRLTMEVDHLKKAIEQYDKSKKSKA